MTNRQRASISQPRHIRGPVNGNARLVAAFTLSGEVDAEVYAERLEHGTAYLGEGYTIRWGLSGAGDRWEAQTMDGDAAIKYAAERVGWAL